MQLLQDPNQSNVDNLNNVRREASRLRDLYRGISDFKNGYQPRTNTVKYE